MCWAGQQNIHRMLFFFWERERERNCQVRDWNSCFHFEPHYKQTSFEEVDASQPNIYFLRQAKLRCAFLGVLQATQSWWNTSSMCSSALEIERLWTIPPTQVTTRSKIVRSSSELQGSSMALDDKIFSRIIWRYQLFSPSLRSSNRLVRHSLVVDVFMLSTTGLRMATATLVLAVLVLSSFRMSWNHARLAVQLQPLRQRGKPSQKFDSCK